jgi:hypothetical protein
VRAMLGNASGAIIQGGGRVSEKLRLCESGSGLTGHERRRILSQVGRRRTPNCAKARREDRGSVSCTGYAGALARTSASMNYEPRVKRKQ